MNISEANDWFAFLRGLELAAGEDLQERSLGAARTLTERANKALGAGPRPSEVEGLVITLQHGVYCAETYEGVVVELGDRPVETTQAAGGVL